MSTDVTSSYIKISEEYVLSVKGSCIGAVLSVASFGSSCDSMSDPYLGTVDVFCSTRSNDEREGGRQILREPYSILLPDQTVQLARVHEWLG
jgi:hypothetical protein